MTVYEIRSGLYEKIYGAPMEGRTGWDPFHIEAHCWEAMDALVAGDRAKAERMSLEIGKSLPGFFMLPTKDRLRWMTLGLAKLSGVLK